MDTFKILIGLIGIVLFSISIYSLIDSFLKFLRRKVKFIIFFRYLLSSFILFLFSIIFILLFLVLQTFTRFYYEEKIGEVYAVKNNGEINISFTDLKNNKKHTFSINGDQWVIEGEIIVFDKWLRWLGARSYYRIVRFSGRFLERKEGILKYYEIINSRSDFWEFVLKNFDRLPFIDTAYGISAFQYPGYKYDVYISDLGFVIRR